jgi:hypothetical protein
LQMGGFDNHSDEIQANDNLAGSVYATILDKWLAGDARQVLGGDLAMWVSRLI